MNPESNETFSNSGYRQQRDMLRATLRLEKNGVVVPFLTDFDGCVKEDVENGRILTYVDESAILKAIISILGAAYIYCCSQMTRLETISFGTRVK